MSVEVHKSIPLDRKGMDVQHTRWVHLQCIVEEAFALMVVVAVVTVMVHRRSTECLLFHP